MTTLIGRNAGIEIADTDSDADYTSIGKVTSLGHSLSNETADETNNDSGGYIETKYSNSQLTATASVKYNSSDAGQAELITAAHAKTDKFFRIRPADAVDELEFRAKMRITSLDGDSSTGEVQDLALTLESTGAVTKATQT